MASPIGERGRGRGIEEEVCENVSTPMGECGKG